MRNLFALAFAIVTLFLISGCGTKQLLPVAVEPSHVRVDYLADVKPILDRRCVVCHSCYNAPCQLKLSSYEGVMRGASKRSVYDGERLHAIEPTRLFVDANGSEAWQRKGFFSVIENSAQSGFNDSTMLQLLSQKRKKPYGEGLYDAEASDLTCAKNSGELSGYLDKHPDYGMPFGFPPLSEKEYRTLAAWLQQGAKGPSVEEQRHLRTPSYQAEAPLRAWETFFNADGVKHRMSARYLYEHLFLAHLYFEGASGEFFELIRSKTPPGEPIVAINTLRPYDDPGVKRVYYRFRKLHATTVHKTHMTFELSAAKLKRLDELFIQAPWYGEPYMQDYERYRSANPFESFAQIPVRSRYAFLLDNAQYIITTFIRGPVCKGQVALNVIHDHFWVMFLDPEYDLSVRFPQTLLLQNQNLRMPNERGSDMSLWKVLSNGYNNRAYAFYKARQNAYARHYPEGLGYDAIWSGEGEASTPLLTVYRHFDSASVHRGALGNLPRTLWVIDYPLLERIYYALVAGFDVFGNIGHQVNTRRYMDRLRIEGENNFLDFLPASRREEIFDQWYQGTLAQRFMSHAFSEMPAQIDFKTDDVKREFVEQLIKQRFHAKSRVTFDRLNYFKAGEAYPDLPQNYANHEDIVQAFRALQKPGTAFIRQINGYDANLAYLRIRLSKTEDAFYTIVVNRWHDNVEFMLNERVRLDPEKDEVDFIEGFVGSYPNFFFDVSLEKLPHFFDLLANYSNDEEQKKKLLHFGISRSDERFWQTFDTFQAAFEQLEPINAGLFDLNRYYNIAR